MININRILCPVDFSTCSRRAFAYAVEMGRWYGASVTAVHVFNNLPVSDAVPLYRGQPLVLKNQDPGPLRSALDVLAQSAAPDCRVVTELIEAPDVQRALARHAEVIDADVIVMGTHGRSGVEGLLLGSVAEGVVRQAGRPILLVPASATRDPAAMPFCRIVCGVDFGPLSRRTCDIALELAEEADAHLTLLHAIEVPPELQVPMTIETVDVAASRAAAEAEALQHLRDLVPDEARLYCKLHTDVREGRADRALVETAIERQADLIVMGNQPHNALDRLVFGSNLHTVLRAAPCPVLAVPAVKTASQIEAA